MRPKSLILLVLALGCGLVASIGINRVMANRPAPEVAEAETVKIYVATKDVNQNDLIPTDAVKEEEWPAAKIPAGAITLIEEIEGRRTRVKLFAGEPVLEIKLLPKGTAGQYVVDNIPAGFRVAAVRVDDVTTLGSLILPGDRVDIMVHLPPQPNRNLQEPITKTFLQDVKVFAVNDVTERQPGGGEAKITARTVAFLVEPAQAELITQASILGQIRLVLRNSSDSAESNTPGASAGDLLNGTQEQGNRAAEVKATQAAAAPNPFLDMIKNQVAPAAQPSVDVAAHPADEYKMIVMRGSDIQEYVLAEGGIGPRPAQVEPTTEATSHDEETDFAPEEQKEEPQPENI